MGQYCQKQDIVGDLGRNYYIQLLCIIFIFTDLHIMPFPWLFFGGMSGKLGESSYQSTPLLPFSPLCRNMHHASSIPFQNRIAIMSLKCDNTELFLTLTTVNTDGYLPYQRHAWTRVNMRTTSIPIAIAIPPPMKQGFTRRSNWQFITLRDIFACFLYTTLRNTATGMYSFLIVIHQLSGTNLLLLIWNAFSLISVTCGLIV